MQTSPGKTPSNLARPPSNSRFATTAFFVCLCLGVPLVIFYFLFTNSINHAKRVSGIAGIKSAASSILMYSLDNNGYFPPADEWMDAAQPFSNSRDAFRSPVASIGGKDVYGIAFRTELGAKQMHGLADLDRWAMVFDSTLMQRNAHSGLETLPTPGRYRTKEGPSNIVAFVDGSAHAIPDDKRKSSGPDGKPAIR